MAQYTNDFRDAKNIDDLKVMLNKYFQWFFSSLDHLNVIQLFTEQCNIQSEKGETVLDGTQIVMKDGDSTIRLLLGLDKATGNFVYTLKDINGNETFSVSDIGQLKLGGRPLFEMYDSNNILRLRMGFDSTINKFVFSMYDETGTETLSLTSTGKALFKGSIQTTEDAKVGNNIEIGNITQTGVAKKIIFYSNGSEQSYIEKDISDNLNLVSYQNMDLQSFLDITIHCLDTLIMSGYNAFNITTTDSVSTSLSKVLHDGSGNFQLGHQGTGQVKAIGDWDFFNANSVTGLNTNSVGYHNHGIPDGTALGVVDGTGAIIGSIAFTASGAHYHSVKKA